MRSEDLKQYGSELLAEESKWWTKPWSPIYTSAWWWTFNYERCKYNGDSDSLSAAKASLQSCLSTCMDSIRLAGMYMESYGFDSLVHGDGGEALLIGLGSLAVSGAGQLMAKPVVYMSKKATRHVRAKKEATSMLERRVEAHLNSVEGFLPETPPSEREGCQRLLPVHGSATYDVNSLLEDHKPYR